ncbi:hypothetical protein AC578_4360 [Pseudocercospora eumusae]|uniref:Uncharacterized protein n=1 Tax=Pseudocercospora eumusae TaxID=321146 RepID=A0A139H5R4_9PEZI|nr:hypothetical protein AC578_4360 [Pseudocercospora eumusae]
MNRPRISKKPGTPKKAAKKTTKKKAAMVIDASECEISSSPALAEARFYLKDIKQDRATEDDNTQRKARGMGP